MLQTLRLVVLVIIGVLALSFFGITIQSIVNSPAGQANFAYLAHVLAQAWYWFAVTLNIR